MNLLKIIEEKAEIFKNTKYFQGINAVIHHIKIAEQHLSDAQTGKEYLYTDAIYRCNQAFEGALKEAYELLTGEEAINKSPYQIEQYFDKNEILKPRVLDLFKKYRTDWRNVSTHNHRLTFSYQEAFLAIVNIIAFFVILLDQMIERISYIEEKKFLDKNLKLKDISSSKTDLLEECAELFVKFAEEFIKKQLIIKKVGRVYESIIFGQLTAFLSSADPNLKIIVEPVFSNLKYIPDLIIEKEENKIVVEIKRSLINALEVEKMLYNVMLNLNIKKGLLFILPVQINDKVMIMKEKKVYDKFEIYKIYPETSNNSLQRTSVPARR